MSKMFAMVFEKQGIFNVKEVDIPKITSDDRVLIKVEACSICGTDVHITNNPPGYVATNGTILGHEFVGTIVEKSQSVTHVAIGDRVVVNPNNYCGTCYFCRKNLPNQCERIEALGIDYDGAFAEYCCVSGKVVYKIDKSVPVEVAALTEPLACAINGLHKVNIRPADSAAVIGAGPIGLMIAMILKKQGASPIYLLETSKFRGDFAKNVLGIENVINPMLEDASKVVNQQCPYGVDFVFDVTGSQIISSINLVRKDGTVVLFGVNKNAKAEIEQHLITTKEINVLGTWLANATFPEAVEIIEKGILPLEKLITDVIPLNQIKEGISKLAKGEAVKIIVKMEGK